MPLLWSNCLCLAGCSEKKTEQHLQKKIELSGNRFFVFLLNIFIFLYPIHFEKVMEDHVKMKDDCSFLLYSCYKFIIPIGFYTTQTNHQSHSQTSVTDLLSHFSHMSFFQKNRKLGMWLLEAIIFLAMDSGFSLTTAAGLPLLKKLPNRLHLPDCTVTHGFAATGSLKKNMKHKRFRE